MNWKGTLCMLGAVLFCTSLMASAEPPGQSTAAVQEAAVQPLTATLEATAAKPKLPEKGTVTGKPRPVSPTLSNAQLAGQRGATILVVIMTDNYGSETTWDVTEQGTGIVVGSGGPYGNNTLYEIPVEVDPASCYDFCIYDAYGDGICCAYGNGYYEVYYEGTLVGSGGEFGSVECVNDIGGGCVTPTGACCIDYVCVATTYEADCDGSWYEGETCPEFECPITGADFLVDAPGEWTGNTCGTGNDCGLRASEEHEYEVVIPEDGMWTFSLCGSDYDTYMFVGTTLCGQEVGYNDDFCGLQSQLTATITAGNYFTTIEAFGDTQCGNYLFSVWQEVEPTGACCVDLDCVATNTYLECQGLGGTWYEGQTCPEFVCPVVPDNDLCENAEPVGPPYPVTVYGSNEAATIDCPGLLDWYSTWWAIELPYVENNLHIDMCENGFEINNVGIVIMDDCACDDYVTYSGIDWYGCPDGITSPHIWWNGIAGPSTWLFPVYFNNGAMLPYRLNIDVVEVQPCVIECEEGDTIEDEPICYDDYVDMSNGGCNSSPSVFQPIACGETICGTSGTFYYQGLSYRDTDWFEMELTVPTTITWTIEAEFEVLIFVMNGGSGNCIDYTILSNITAPECTPASLTESVGPGLYWFWVGPTVFGSGVPCGSIFRGTLTCEPYEIRGACCDDDTGDCEENVLMEDCPPPLRFAADTTCADINPPCGGCPDAMIIIEIMTDTWPSETTWQVTDYYPPYDVVGSGGPYSESNHLYTEGVCVPYEGCWDFTIYDAYGDGIYSPGGYAVYFEGELIYSCIGQGWCCTSETVEMFGDGCVYPEGACCISVEGVWECLHTNTEPECDDLGGRFYVGETCPDFDCPQCDVDYCVEAPYAGPMRNTCGEGDDCATHAGEDHQYEVSIPNDGTWTFSLCGSIFDTYMYVGTTVCGQEVGYNDDYCGLQSQLTADVTAGLYYVDVEGFGGSCGEYLLNVWEEIPCDVECPPEGTPEGEPVCEDDYEDTYNGGCNSLPNIFQPITCNEIMCGESGTFYYQGLSYRDTDWFEIELQAATNITWTVCAEFEVLIFVIDGGSGNCVDYTILGNQTNGPFMPATLSFDVGPGLYWFWVGPTVFGSGVPCGSVYVGELIVEPDVCICGDLDDDNDVDEDDYWLFLDAFGSCVGDPKYREDADFDADGCITLVDYQAWIVCFREANPGKSLPDIRRTLSGRGQGSQGGSQKPSGPVPR